MANFQKIGEDLTAQKVSIEAVPDSEDPQKTSHHKLMTTKYDVNTGAPYQVEEKLPSEDELLAIIAATKKELAGLQVTLAIIQGK